MLLSAARGAACTPRWWRIVSSVQHYVLYEDTGRVRVFLDSFAIPGRYDKRALAMLATAVEYCCNEREICPPAWCDDERTVLDEPYFGELASDPLILFTAPDYALKHNVLLPPNSWSVM
jgi:hypothetical protein